MCVAWEYLQMSADDSGESREYRQIQGRSANGPCGRYPGHGFLTAKLQRTASPNCRNVQNTASLCCCECRCSQGWRATHPDPLQPGLLLERCLECGVGCEGHRPPHIRCWRTQLMQHGPSLCYPSGQRRLPDARGHSPSRVAQSCGLD